MMTTKHTTLFLIASILAAHTLAIPVPQVDWPHPKDFVPGYSDFDMWIFPWGRWSVNWDFWWEKLWDQIVKPVMDDAFPALGWDAKPEGAAEYKEFSKHGWPLNDFWWRFTIVDNKDDEKVFMTYEPDADKEKVKDAIIKQYMADMPHEQGLSITKDDLAHAEQLAHERGRQAKEAELYMNNWKPDVTGSVSVEVDCNSEFWKGKRKGDTVVGQDGAIYVLPVGCEKQQQ